MSTNYPTPETPLEVRQQLHNAVTTGHVLIPYYEAEAVHIQPWPATTINYNPEGNPISEPPEGQVIGTQDIDVAIFTSITGYMGPKALLPLGSARIMQRVNRFSKAEQPAISSLYSIAALSFAGKIALHDNEATGKAPTFVCWAKAEQLEKRPGLFPFASRSTVEIQGSVRVTSEALSINPYELPAVEAIDWGTQAIQFNEFSNKAIKK